MQVIDNVVGQKYSTYVYDEMVKLKWTYNENRFAYDFFNSPEYLLAASIILETSDKLGKKFNMDHVIDCFGYLTPQQDKIKLGNPYTKNDAANFKLIYFANTVDGETLFFDNKNKVIDKVKPQMGRVLLFSNDWSYAESTPTECSRFVINTSINI